MLVKSAIVSEGSGALGGLVWSHNAGGQYLRQRVVPTNPQTMRQGMSRTALSQISEAWSGTLNQGQRDAWIAYADAVELPGPLGDFRTVSGLNMFIACNVPRIVAGLDRVDDGPTTLTLAPLSMLSMAVATDWQPTVTFTDGDTWAGEDDAALIVQLGLGVMNTINFFKGPYASTWIVAGNTMTPVTTPQDPTQVSGSVAYAPTAGQRVFWRARATLADGRLSSPQTGFAVAT